MLTCVRAVLYWVTVHKHPDDSIWVMPSTTFMGICTLCVMIRQLALLRKRVNKGQHIILSMLMMSKEAIYVFYRRPTHFNKNIHCFREKDQVFILIIDEVVVVVNHCFTSLFVTNGLLSDIVIR